MCTTMGSHVLTQAISHKVSPGLLPAWIAKHQLSRQDPCRMATALPGPESTTCFFSQLQDILFWGSDYLSGQGELSAY